MLCLSIPYWDFLVLNLHLAVSSKSSLTPFNSLLGFSSFESLTKRTFDLDELSFQFPIGIF